MAVAIIALIQICQLQTTMNDRLLFVVSATEIAQSCMPQ